MKGRLPLVVIYKVLLINYLYFNYLAYEVFDLYNYLIKIYDLRTILVIFIL